MNSASTSPTSDSKRNSDTNSVTTMITTIPHLLSTPATHMSNGEQREFMKLTPVNLQCLTSPPRQAAVQAGADISCLHSHEFRLDDTYRENFNMISRQLEKLLENLNVIYRQIGYSNAEIISKEKLIFKTLSGSITSFFDHAENDMKMLNAENETAQELLNRMLEILRDANGLSTIPDIYVRNAILIPSCKTVFQSPKKPVSLLSKRKLLRTARGYVFKVYVPALIQYLECSIQLQACVGVINENLPNLPNGELVMSMPNLDSLKFFRDSVKTHQSDLEFLSNFFAEHKKEILYSEHFNDVSETKAQVISQLAKAYKNEYTSRFLKMNSMAETISKLVSELRADLDPQVKKLVTIYSQCDSQTLPKKYLPMHKSTMESLHEVLQEYQSIHQSRKESKEALLAKCESLWVKLKMPKAYVDNFLAQTNGLSAAVTKKITKELGKLETMKKKLIKTLIDESLQRIEEFWDILQYEPQERAQFMYLFDSLRNSSSTLEDDEKLLETCENEIKDLEGKLRIYKPVLQLVEEFEFLQTDKMSLEQSSRDSSRLLARNSHKILLQEEKTRKRVTRHFPRVIKELKIGLEKIEETFGKPLMIDGQNLMEKVMQIEEELVSKYPKSRLNLGRQNSKSGNLQNAKKINDGKVSKKPITERLKRKNVTNKMAAPSINNRAVGYIDQTPVTKIVGNYCSSTTHSNIKQDSSQGKQYMRGTTACNSTKPLNSLLPPKQAVKGIVSRIPEPPRIQRTQSLDFTSSPLFKPKSTAGKFDLVKPATLFQVSPNKMNQKRSQIPTLSKSSSLLTSEFMNTLDKENLVDSTPRLQHNRDNIIFSSPYKEPENSIYKISKSPDGKCTLNVKENSQLESGFDDTSFMDDDNEQDFNLWKNEQLARIQTTQAQRIKRDDIV
ncbi:ZYBA0S08-02168g1_1 [Zygosaccharomyces bailii CLIB 213]|uniref:ZYBA0S08-02168g1_1 n=1 Tax=Zygosaccharomyces bailii (strain CLIB 213 / ATCC 58445 / CBS 680 / BCRC 21525 / NBRC 1098 / NCYC 1416 / NRRL Y-2227) TaxID=1333698 RepID=A0A8J2X360_ZYGB2|nr:ZYBA0S08-02168g1_1 [Zygosaccharomyces bailii CLIB 213]